jgi:hypothetical protein
MAPEWVNVCLHRTFMTFRFNFALLREPLLSH